MRQPHQLRRTIMGRRIIYMPSEGKLGRVYSYYNFKRACWVYVHVLSEYAARINERLALARANQPKSGDGVIVYYEKRALESARKNFLTPLANRGGNGLYCIPRKERADLNCISTSAGTNASLKIPNVTV